MISLSTVLIDTRRREIKSRLVQSVYQKTNTVTDYPVKSYPTRRRVGAALIGVAVAGLSGIVCAWVMM